MTALDDEIQRYIADYALQKYEQAQALKDCNTTGQYIDYCITMGNYLSAAHILDVIRNMKLKGLYKWKHENNIND